jgi:hypothetical protein
MNDDRPDDLRPAASCCSCRSTDLRPMIVLARSGTPPWVKPHHGFVYHHLVVFLCVACFSGQIELWSHDCFVMAVDDPWDYYDWYVLDASDMLRLRAPLGACPTPLRPECECAVHEALRVACRELPRSAWLGFAFASRGDGTEVHRVSVDVEDDLPRLVSRAGPSLHRDRG